MICKGILNLCGTSSEEIIERTKKEAAEYYLPKIDQLSSKIDAFNPYVLSHWNSIDRGSAMYL